MRLGKSDQHADRSTRSPAVVKSPEAKVSLSQVSFGVVLVEPSRVADANQRLMAVSDAARRHGVFLIEPQQTQAQLDVLPRDAVTWLTRLGVITLGDLRQLPRTELLARLGASAERRLELAVGIDEEPLNPYPPAPTITESFEWEEPTSALEALTLALRRLTVRLETRLRGRGVAAEHWRIFAALTRNRIAAVWDGRFQLSSPI